ncbi:MAG: hypothetical protein IKF82_01080 [Bacilli bacterium]|nr:hypothetical protein [Bacilli bacterium]
MKDLFGEETSLDDYLRASEKTNHKKYISMQVQYGEKQGFKCKDCKHFIRNNHNYKTYFKCGLWHISNSEATDIRANQTACNKYEVKK